MWGSHRRAAAGPLGREDKCLYTIPVRFEWDPREAGTNLHVHGIRFAKAVTVREDAFVLTREDPDAGGEQRFRASQARARQDEDFDPA